MDDLWRPLLTTVVLVLVVLVGWAVAARYVGFVTIREYQRGLRFQRGRIVGLLETGSHWYVRPWTEIQIVDSRPSSIAIDGQELLTADGVAVKVSLVVRSVIGDPIARLTADQDADRLLYLLVQLGLREVIAGRELADVLSARTTIGPAIAEIAAARMGEIGIELLSVDVRDVMVPSDLKRAYAAVVTARQEGAASLERARAETAALRNLANAGSMLDAHPGLLSLRLVQELASSAGNTVVLGLPDADAAGVPTVASRRGRTASSKAPERPA